MDGDPEFVDSGDKNAARELVGQAEQGALFLYPGNKHLFTDRSLDDHDPAATVMVLDRVLAFPTVSPAQAGTQVRGKVAVESPTPHSTSLQNQETTMTDATIRTLEAALTAALVANDAEAVGALFAEDWVYVTPEGPIGRTEILGAIASDRLQHFSFETLGEPRLVVQGDTAIFTSHEISTGAWEGAPYRTDEWITDIWLRQPDGRWLCAMSQKTDAAG